MGPAGTWGYVTKGFGESLPSCGYSRLHLGTSELDQASDNWSYSRALENSGRCEILGEERDVGRRSQGKIRQWAMQAEQIRMQVGPRGSPSLWLAVML